MSPAAGGPSIEDRVENLSTDLFASIPSQTSVKDRRSLLAVQRSTARRFGRFAYLEIGSHLGIDPAVPPGSALRRHLLDRLAAGIPAGRPVTRLPGGLRGKLDATHARSTARGFPGEARRRAMLRS